MSDSEGVERRGWEDELNAAWEVVDVWRGRFEDAAARETALHEQLAGMVPCDDAAVERVAHQLCEQRGWSWDKGNGLHFRNEFCISAAELLRAAGAQQDAAAKPKASGPDA